jgi:phage tail sheath protein FI
MAASFLHGVETIEIDKGPRPVQLVKTAVIGLIGTAAAGALNEPIIITSEKDFAQFGENIPNSTLLDALDAIFDQKATVVVVINVLDPANAAHKTTLSSGSAETVTVDPQDGTFQLAHAAVSGLTLTSFDQKTTYDGGTTNTDFEFDPTTGKGKRITSGTIPAGTVASPTQLKASYSYLNPTLVQPSDIIGSIDPATAKRLGMKAFRDSYQLFGFYPKILIAPVFSSLAAVSSELIVTATSIRAITFIDAPIGITPQQAITGRGPLGTINFNTSSERAGLCYPHAKTYDVTTDTEVLAPLSQYAAGAQAKKDQENGYWWSLSNTELNGITGMERPIDAMINDPNCEANLLNAAGIITLFNSFGTGIRIWGNRSAAFPSSTHPKNFLCVRRTADIIAESLEYFTLQFNDRPFDNALIDAIVESCNGFLRTLKANGAVIDGKSWFDPADNEVTELAAGHLTITYDFMPPTPAERVTYKSTVNIDYLNTLGQK